MLACVNKRWRFSASLPLLLWLLLALLLVVVAVILRAILRRRHCWRRIVPQADADADSNASGRHGRCGRRRVTRLTHYRAHKTIGHDKVSEKLITSNDQLLSKDETRVLGGQGEAVAVAVSVSVAVAGSSV